MDSITERTRAIKRNVEVTLEHIAEPAIAQQYLLLINEQLRMLLVILEGYQHAPIARREITTPLPAEVIAAYDYTLEAVHEVSEDGTIAVDNLVSVFRFYYDALAKEAQLLRGERASLLLALEDMRRERMEGDL